MFHEVFYFDFIAAKWTGDKAVGIVGPGRTLDPFPDFLHFVQQCFILMVAIKMLDQISGFDFNLTQGAAHKTFGIVDTGQCFDVVPQFGLLYIYC
jgi:hypothetical protein